MRCVLMRQLVVCGRDGARGTRKLWSLGSERSGVSQAVLDLADAAVAIPMQSMANSLNIATAAAIVLYAMRKEAQSLAATAIKEKIL